MVGSPRPEISTNEGDRVLREQVEHVVASQLGADREIVAFEKTLFPHIGSYDCFTVSVQLGDGATFRFFLKDYGFSRQSKDTPKARRDRELRVYRDLLAEAKLGTPAYYGSLWDEQAARFWLLIELVEGIPVDEANVEFGAAAAGWLARMHRYFAQHPEPLAACSPLNRLDAGFFRAKAVQAMANVARISSAAARRLEGSLSSYEAAIPVMATGPHTLVHGGFIPWHLLIDRAHDPERVCVIDWELAAIGSPVYDLAFFVDDADEPVIDGICDAYLAASHRSGAGTRDPAWLRHSVDCFRLHRVFDWLGRSVEKQYSRRKIDWLVDRAAARCARIAG